MPFINRGSGRKHVLATISGLALVCLAAPTAQAKDSPSAANPLSCVPQPNLVQPFAALGDAGNYTLLPGGDFEGDMAGWTLAGASTVDGNETFSVGAPSDDQSLALPAGSFAASAPFCLDDTYPSFRFFARNSGDPKAQMSVDILYVDARGKLHSRASGTFAASSAWTLTSALSIGLTFDPTSTGGAAPVSFRFTPQGKGGNWQIDDVYIDPMARR